ncbi:TonB-dependent receptor domain-containing protein [Sphingomonas sp. IC081]|uniref:TonB-dependent receptor domain-containing protein n=1 Tax=Sphingomonas sp. IC081 TaxID=304378 RepID=UPI0011646BF3|nr:TonB-dependent receptor [Sphingomonas sp. IC081]QDK35685.1 hypothetical protein DM450_23450 [Sphingomonas sp. IC081]
MGADQLSIATSFYYYDYKDYQAYLFSNASGFVSNRKARTYGAELALSARITRSLTASLSGSILNARVRDVTIAPATATATAIIADVKPAFAPEKQVAAQAQWITPWSVAGGEVEFGGDLTYTGHFYHNIRNFSSNRIGDYVLVNGRIGWRNTSGLSINFLVNNVFNKRYESVGFDLTTISANTEVAYGMPRNWAITLNQKF